MKYFAMIDGEQRGPFELDQLAEAGVRPSTYIWCKDMTDWEKAEDVAEVCRMFRVRLYDLMHPTAPAGASPERDSVGRYEGHNPEEGSGPTRFDRHLNDMTLPSLEEIDSRVDITRKPSNMVLPAVLATIFFFPPLGIFAIYFALASKRCWAKSKTIADNSEIKEIKDSEGQISLDDWRRLAHEYARAAKMWTGVTFFIGLILYGFIFSRLI